MSFLNLKEIEDIGQNLRKDNITKAVVHKRKRIVEEESYDLSKSWREVLGPIPEMGSTRESLQTWLRYHKKKWKFQV